MSLLSRLPGRIQLSLRSLSPEDGERIPLYSSVRGSNHLVRWPIGDALQGIRDARQVIKQLVAHSRPLQDDRSPSVEVLNGPSRCHNQDNCTCDELFVTGYGESSAKNRKDMIREQFFLPAGAQLDNYMIGCLFAHSRQWIS